MNKIGQLIQELRPVGLLISVKIVSQLRHYVELQVKHPVPYKCEHMWQVELISVLSPMHRHNCSVERV